MKKSSNSKIIWICIFVFLAVVLCYMFVVLYFFYISPNNIPLKISLWPFMSSQSIGELYQDATVQINYEYTYDFESSQSVSVVGVNVREDGYVIAPYDQMKYAITQDEVEISINTNSGTVYFGEILFSSDVFNICIIKCESATEGGKVSIPYVSLSVSSLSDVVSITYGDDKVWTSTIGGYQDYLNEIQIGIYNDIDFVVEDCYGMLINDDTYNGTVVFDLNGTFLGFAYKVNNNSATFNYNIIPVECVQLVLDDVVACYEAGQSYDNSLADSFVGLDGWELYYHYNLKENDTTGNEEAFYFSKSQDADENGWVEYNNEIEKFYTYFAQLYNSDSSSGGGLFLLNDFEYGNVKISQYNLICRISVYGSDYQITSKVEFFWILYQLEEGDEVTLYLYDFAYNNPFSYSVTFTI